MKWIARLQVTFIILLATSLIAFVKGRGWVGIIGVGLSLIALGSVEFVRWLKE